MTDNELIAEFMGMIRSKHRLTPFHKYQVYWSWGKDGFGVAPYMLKYDTSWDWLMPVVERINKLDDQVHLSIRVAELISKIRKCVCMAQIKDAHMYTVEFIKWYNNRTRCNDCKTPHFCNSNIDRPCVINQESA